MEEDEEDYGFEYSDEDDQVDDDVDIENQYYLAEGQLDHDAESALRGFGEVLAMEKEKGEWGFMALKQTVKVLCRQKKYGEMLERYREMLTYIRSAVTRNHSEGCINEILDFVSKDSQQMVLLQEFYEITLGALQQARNERLWFKTNLKLGMLWFGLEEYGRLSKILRELHKSCAAPDGTDDQKKATQLLEIYALEIQLYTATKNNKKLKQLYERALAVSRAAIPHPRILGVTLECGGKMFMESKAYESAAKDFYEAFKNYDEAGDSRRIQCLKYLVLANMMSLSEIDPFASPEAKAYTTNREIVAMTDLVSAYTRKDIHEFERILKDNKESIMDDAFIRSHIQDLLTKFRTQVLLKLIEPYTKLSLSYISEELNIPAPELESLLTSLILDEKIRGLIDQVGQKLELQRERGEQRRFAHIVEWSEHIFSLHTAITSRLRD